MCVALAARPRPSIAYGRRQSTSTRFFCSKVRASFLALFCVFVWGKSGVVGEGTTTRNVIGTPRPPGPRTSPALRGAWPGGARTRERARAHKIHGRQCDKKPLRYCEFIPYDIMNSTAGCGLGLSCGAHPRDPTHRHRCNGIVLAYGAMLFKAAASEKSFWAGRRRVA